MFFTGYVLCSLRLLKLRRPNNISRKPHHQVKKYSHKNHHLSWAFNQALNIPAQEPSAFRLAIYYVDCNGNYWNISDFCHCRD